MSEASVSGAADRASRLARIGGGLCAGGLCGFLSVSLHLPALVSRWPPYSPLIIASALLGGALALTRLRKLVTFAAIGLSALWIAVAFTPLAKPLSHSMVRADVAGRADFAADAIFVFSSSLQPDGELTSTAMARLLRGLELLGEKRAPRLIVSELPLPTPRYEVVARALKEHLGVGGELLAVGPIQTTHDEGRAVAELCRRRGWHKIIAVSSPTHTRRAAAVLEHEGLEVLAVPAAETRFDLERLDYSDDRLLAFGAAMHDLLGYEVYRLRGFITAAH